MEDGGKAEERGDCIKLSLRLCLIDQSFGCHSAFENEPRTSVRIPPRIETEGVQTVER